VVCPRTRRPRRRGARWGEGVVTRSHIHLRMQLPGLPPGTSRTRTGEACRQWPRRRTVLGHLVVQVTVRDCRRNGIVANIWRVCARRFPSSRGSVAGHWPGTFT
jgi:hypothetical protein